MKKTTLTLLSLLISAALAFSGCSKSNEPDNPEDIYEVVECKSGNIKEVVSGLKGNNTYYLKVTAKVNNQTIENLSSAMKQDRSVKLYVDLSETTGLENFRGMNNHENLLGITFPKDTKIIVWGTFKKCYNLKYIKFHKDNKNFKMDGDALYSADGSKLILAMPWVKSIKIKDGVTMPIQGQFAEREYLENVELPGTISKLDNSFMNLKKLKSVKIRNAERNAPLEIFYSFINCPELTTVQADKTICTASLSFDSCPKLKDVSINFTGINESFKKLPAYEEMNLGDKIEKIEGSFYDCENLTKVNLGKILTEIPLSFNKCPKITNVDFPDTLKEVRNSFDSSDLETVKMTFYIKGKFANSIKDLYISDELVRIEVNSFKKVERIHLMEGAEYFFEKMDYSGDEVFLKPPYKVTVYDGTIVKADKDSIISKEAIFSSPEALGEFFTSIGSEWSSHVLYGAAGENYYFHNKKYYNLKKKGSSMIEKRENGFTLTFEHWNLK